MTTEKVGRVRRCMLAPYAFEGISTWLACDELPFCVSLTSRHELSAALAARRGALLAEWDDWAEHAQSVVELSAAVIAALVGMPPPRPYIPINSGSPASCNNMPYSALSVVPATAR